MLFLSIKQNKNGRRARRFHAGENNCHRPPNFFTDLP